MSTATVLRDRRRSSDSSKAVGRSGSAGRRLSESEADSVAVQAGLGRAIWVVCGSLAILGLTSVNPAVTFFGFLIPPVLFTLLWRNNEPPVLLFAATFQWLQAICPILSANMEGQTLFGLMRGPELEQAAWLSLLGVLVVAVGMFLAITGMPTAQKNVFHQLAVRLSRKKLFIGYIATQLGAVVLTWVAMRSGGLRQLLLALAAVKWIPLFLLCWSTMQCRKPYGWMVLAVAIEVIIGFTGFFSGFKTVLFLMIVVTAGTGATRKSLPKFQLAAIASLTLLLVMFWQAVKVEYRSFLNQGTGAQVVAVPFHQRLMFLARSTTSVTWDDMMDGLIAGIDRLGYIRFFAHSIRHVPAVVPHQEGELWGGAVTHVFMPRVFFPDKPVIDASSRTNQFTGLHVAGIDRGTAITIGFIGESYIDFGVPGMFVPLILLGLLFGGVYRYFCWISSNRLLGLSLSTTLTIQHALFIGASNISMVGGIIINTLMLSFFVMYYGETVLRLTTHPAAPTRRRIV